MTHQCLLNSISYHIKSYQITMSWPMLQLMSDSKPQHLTVKIALTNTHIWLTWFESQGDLCVAYTQQYKAGTAYVHLHLSYISLYIL